MTAPFYENTIRDWLIAIAIAAIAMLLLFALKMLLRRRLAKAAETETDIDDFVLDLVNHTRLLLLLFPVVALSFRALLLTPKADYVLRVAAMLGFLLQFALWASEFADFWFRRYRRKNVNDPSAITTIAAVSFMARIVLWSVITVVALDNLGFNVTALVTGLGIGGVAVALATQNILSDLFSSLSIVVDKPFVIGDTIAVDDHVGKVEYIGLKTTRLRSVNGEQIIFSNSELLKSRIRNLQRMAERRIVLKLPLAYTTSDDSISQLGAIAQKTIEAAHGRFGGAQILTLSPHHIDFEIAYFIPATEPVLQNTINLALLRSVRGEGVELGVPRV
jgi:small-conductance mechanosensitive channel